MSATQTVETLLNQVKSSNFHLQQSPFSAIISLKKSFVKDKAGQLLLPKPVDHSLKSKNCALTEKNIHLEKVIDAVRGDYEDTLNDMIKLLILLKKNFITRTLRLKPKVCFARNLSRKTVSLRKR